MHIRDPRGAVSVAVMPVGAAGEKAESAEGYLVYRNALGAGAHLIHKPTSSGSEDFLLAPSAALASLTYDVRLEDNVAGLRLVDGVLEFLDVGGAPRVRVGGVRVTDSAGLERTGDLALHGCGVDTSPAAPWGRPVTAPGANTCQLEVRWDGHGLKYPLLVDPTWSSTQTMTVGRISPGLARLPGGNVLAFGGSTGGACTTGNKSSELYNPATDTWSISGPTFTTHVAPGAASFGNGDVLAFGDTCHAASDTWPPDERYHAALGSWGEGLVREGQQNNSYSGSAIVPSASDVYVFGGTGGDGTNTHCYHFTNAMTLLHCAPLPSGLATNSASGIDLKNGYLMVAGGMSNRDAAVYSPAYDAWYGGYTMSSQVSSPQLARLANGDVLAISIKATSAFADTFADVFDFTTGSWSWSAGPTMLAMHIGGTLTALADGRLLSAGGRTLRNGVTSVELLNAARTSWQATINLPAYRQDHRAILLPDGRVLVAGGQNGLNVALPTSTIYQPDYSNDLDPCDDGNVCTDDSVDVDGSCSHSANTGACDDGDKCTAVDTCTTQGQCVGASPVACSASDQCHAAGTCVPATGQCTNPPVTDGTQCDDGSVCTNSDACSNGLCQGAAVSCPAAACETATCDPQSGCGVQSMPNGTACDDANACSTGDACSSGYCVGTPLSCPAPTACHLAGNCDSLTGGCSEYPVPDGTPCGQGTICSAGSCVANAGGAGAGGSGGAYQTGAVATDVGTGTAFLYTASGTGSGAIPPVQTPIPGQAALQTVIDPNHAGVVRGRVLAVTAPGGTAAPLAGATVTLLGHVELGQTLTQADGWFDLAVNAGGMLTVDVSLSGYLSVQRSVQTRWHQYSLVDDVVLTPLDQNANHIDLTLPTYTSARGSVMHDDNGTRQATLFFPPGTTATLGNADGTTGQTLSTLTVRATEFTVGQTGVQAMPGSLPPASAYTYAVELSADEVSQHGAAGVTFSNEVPLYVDNFRNFPVGSTVPSGYYDRQKGQWVAAKTGVVLQIHSVAVPVTVELTAGVVASASDLAAAGIPQPELDALATVYAAGTELWRSPVTHFTPYDENQGSGPPADAKPPPAAKATPTDTDTPCTMAGSIIECENQILGEDIPLLGTPFTLHYQSDRTRDHAHKVHLKVTDESIPSDLLGVVVHVQIAGRDFGFDVLPQPNQYVDMTWDGLDAYGRVVEGPTTGQVHTEYRYPQAYAEASSFGSGGGYTLPQTVVSPPVFVARNISTFTIGSFDAKPLGFGGWMLSDEHVYAPDDGYVFEGNGKRVTSSLTATVRDIIPGGILGASMFGVIHGDDGSIYLGGYLDSSWAIAKVDAAGARTSIPIDYPPIALAFTSQGLLTGGNGGEIRAVNPDGTTRLLNAGSGTECPGTGCVDTPSVALSQARFGNPIRAMVTAPDGTLYVTTDHYLRRVGTDGMVTNVAGDGFCNVSNAPPGPQPGADPVSPFSVHVCPDVLAMRQNGAILYATYQDCRVFELDPSQTQLRLVAGATPCDSGWQAPGFTADLTDFGDATGAGLDLGAGITSIVEGTDGTIYLGTQLGGSTGIFAIRPNNIVEQVVGSPGATGIAGELAPDVANSAPTGMTLDGNGNVIFTNPDSKNVDMQGYWKELRTVQLLPGFQSGSMLIAEPDSNEVFTFNSAGQHLQTQSWRTGALRDLLSYDSTSGQLTSVTDGGGNVTSVSRSGTSVVITAPFGQTTTISLDSNGYASSVANSGGQTWTTVHQSNGLLKSLTDPKQQEHKFDWTDDGLLMKDSNPAGGFTALVRTLTDPDNAGWTTMATTAAGVTKSIVYSQPAGSTNSAKTVTTGGLASSSSVSGSTESSVSADGTTTAIRYAADPRFGASGRYVASTTITPGGAVPALTVTETRGTPTLATPGNPFSIQSETDQTTIAGNTYTRELAGGNTVTVTSPEQRKSTVVYDAKERVQQVSYPGTGLATETYAYNDAACGANPTQGCGGRLMSVTATGDGDTRTTALHYPTAPDTGFPSSVVDALGRTVSYTRYPSGLPSDVALPDGTSHVGYTYDQNQNVSSVTVPAQNVHNFSAYDGEDDLVTYAPPAPDAQTAGQPTSYVYDHDQQLSQLIVPWDTATRTLLVDRTGDPLDRIKAITDPTSAATSSTWSYDTGGHLGTAATQSTTSSFSYAGSFLTSTTTALLGTN